MALTEGGEKNKLQNTRREKASRPSLDHLHLCSCHGCCLWHSMCVHCCAYGWCGMAQEANSTPLGPSRSLVPNTESQYETWHHEGRMTKTISTNSLNFTNFYLLSYFLCSSIHRKYLHNSIGMNGSGHKSFSILSLKDKLKQAGGHVHSGKQRIAAASRTSGINRYEDDLIICIKLYTEKET